MKLTASGLFPLCEAHAADRYQILPIFACFISGALVLIWLLSEWLREKRTARLYGGEDDPAD